MEVILFIQGTIARVLTWCKSQTIFGTNILYILLSFYIVKKIIEWFFKEKGEIKVYERRRK